VTGGSATGQGRHRPPHGRERVVGDGDRAVGVTWRSTATKWP